MKDLEYRKQAAAIYPEEHGLPCTTAECKRRIIIAEDYQQIRRLLGDLFREEGYQVIEVQNGFELLSKIAEIEANKDTLDLVISDIAMPGLSGLEALKLIRARSFKPPVILITGTGDYHTRAEASRLGAAAIFDKLFEIEELLAAVRRLFAET